MDNGPDILSLNGVSVGYEGKEVLGSITASVAARRFVLLLGANGKGKSTLLRTLSGYLSPICGEIDLYGLDLFHSDPKDIAKVISFLPGKLNVPIDVTVEDMMQYGRIPYLKGMQRLSKADYKIIDEVVAEMEIKDLLGSSYNSLSDGQRQLVNIARSLVQQTPIIALDEPTSNLDIINKRKVFELLKLQSEKGRLVLCCTHDFREALNFCTDIWMINKNAQFETFEYSKNLDPKQIEEKLFPS